MSQAHAAPGVEPTPLMLQVLRWVSNAREGERINAAIYADAIARCLQCGLLRIDGTLSQAAITVTERGRELLELAP